MTESSNLKILISINNNPLYLGPRQSEVLWEVFLSPFILLYDKTPEGFQLSKFPLCCEAWCLPLAVLGLRSPREVSQVQVQGPTPWASCWGRAQASVFLKSLCSQGEEPLWRPSRDLGCIQILESCEHLCSPDTSSRKTVLIFKPAHTAVSFPSQSFYHLGTLGNISAFSVFRQSAFQMTTWPANSSNIQQVLSFHWLQQAPLSLCLWQPILPGQETVTPEIPGSPCPQGVTGSRQRTVVHVHKRSGSREDVPGPSHPNRMPWGKSLMFLRPQLHHLWNRDRKKK